MSPHNLLQSIRSGEPFQRIRSALHKATGLTLCLDSLDNDDPTRPLTDDFCSQMLRDPMLAQRCRCAHQEVRQSMHPTDTSLNHCPAGMVHVIVPVHTNGEKIGFLRCGGILDPINGMLNFLNFRNSLGNENFDISTIEELDYQIHCSPRLYPNDLDALVEWIAHQAARVDKRIGEIDDNKKSA